MYGREARMIGLWPTNDGLVMTYVAGPIGEFHAFREDIAGNLLASFDLATDLGERVRAATRAERYYGTANTASYFRTPFGPGWALVGDAGLAMDPVTGQGISDALRDSELLADAIADGLDGRKPLETVLREYERARNDAVKPMYDFTAEIASFGAPKLEQELMFKALARDPRQAQQFFGVLAGAVPIAKFFGPGEPAQADRAARLREDRRRSHATTSRCRPPRLAPEHHRHAAPTRHSPMSDRMVDRAISRYDPRRIRSIGPNRDVNAARASQPGGRGRNRPSAPIAAALALSR